MVLQQLIFKLPKDNSMALMYVLAFFKELILYSEKNDLARERICEILSECIIGEDKFAMILEKGPSEDSSSPKTPKKIPLDSSKRQDERLKTKLRIQGILMHLLV